MNFYKSSLLAFLAIIVFALSISAQTGKPNFNRAQTYDVQNYILRINFDRTAKKIFGDTTVQLKPLSSNFKSIELDAADLNFEAVAIVPENKILQFRTSGEKVYVELDKNYSPQDTISIRFVYTATPKKGIYFVDAEVENGKTIRDSQIWTQGETEEAHHWFPSFDFPSDKATTEQFITAEKGETVIGNGELIEQKDNSDGTVTFHYKMSVPHSTYLVSFIVGKFVKASETYKTIPLGFYIYPGKESIVPKAYGRTKDMFRVFEELTKIDYPFNKYDQTMVANFNFGGMENITATTMADTEILSANFPLFKGGVEDLVSHELAHSWFGNLVTCKNWAELWLNEGFATFMEAAFREKMYGRADYLRKIRSDAQQFIVDDAVNKNRHGLYNQLARPDDSIFDVTTYQKGGAVIHTLRETIGDAAFWKALNIYLNRHKYGNVETGDLQKTLEETSGVNLEWFFRQWVYGAGHPKLDVTQVYNSKSKTLKVTVSQLQKADSITPEAFILPLELEIKTANGIKVEKIEIKNRVEIFSFKLNGKPSEIKLDVNEKIPIKTVRIQPLTTQNK
ncbi:MAG: M1 family metallopeptidase [Acidobacteriota bacterium]|nr:M1 family metallopeptidase [Acidobacteriota bacterium]